MEKELFEQAKKLQEKIKLKKDRMEDLMDLFAGEFISKEEYAKIRGMFRSGDKETRTMAINLVKMQHQKYKNKKKK